MIVWRNENLTSLGMPAALEPHTLLEILRFFIVFEKQTFNDKSGLSITQIIKKLAIAVFETLKKNVTLDWQHKENVRAKIRVAVKRVLKKYGYPPDMQKLAVDRVIKQAELIAENLAKIV